MEKATFISNAKRPLTFNLPHEIYCEITGICSCGTTRVVTQELDPKTGRSLSKIHDLRTPGSVTLFHKRPVVLSVALLQCPGVQAAIDNRPNNLKVIRQR